jgi:hypothetical protein
LANGKSGDWWLNLAADVGGGGPSEPEAHFYPMHVRKITIPLRYSGEELVGIVGYNFQGSGHNQPNSFVRHFGIAVCSRLEPRHVRCQKCPMPMFEGVCPHAGKSMMQRLRHLTKCMISEAIAARDTKSCRQGTIPGKDDF